MNKKCCFVALAAVAVAATVLCSVLIIRAKEDNKNEDSDKLAGVSDETTIYATEEATDSDKLTGVSDETTIYATEEEATDSPEKLTDDYKLLYEGFDIHGSDIEGSLYFREDIGELSLWSDGKFVWRSDGHSPVGTNHPGQRSYYVAMIDGSSYLMEYTPYVGQGVGALHYEIFSIDVYGNEKIIDEGKNGFILFKKSDGDSVFPIDDIMSFSEKVEGYIENGRLLVSTVRGAFEYDDSGDKDNKIFPYLRYIDPWIYDSAVSESLDEYDSLRQALTKLEESLPVMSQDWDVNFENMKNEVMSRNEKTE